MQKEKQLKRLEFKKLSYQDRLNIYEQRKQWITAKDHKDYERQIQELCRELDI